MRRRRVIITGGAGFIGSHLCEALLEDGASVTCVDNLVGTGGSTDNIVRLFDDQRFRFVKAPYEEWIADADLAGVECIYHQAASKMVVSITDPELDLRVNGLGTLRLLLAAARASVRKVVFASTGSVLGERVAPQNEEHPTRPASAYGCSKLLAESYVRALGAAHSVDTTILRYFHVIGPRQNDSETGGVVPIFVRNCLTGEPITIFGTGEQVRSFTWIGDVVRANLQAERDPAMSNETYICASGIRVTILELAQFVRSETGADVPIEFGPWRHGDIVNFDVDNRKITGIGVEFTHDWRAGVRHVIAYARARDQVSTNPVRR
jgi:UDP-glucose 4-epimerase